jgi:GTPase SAR1 family protein
MKDTIEAVTEAMSTLVPPVPLGDPANEDHLKYVRDQATRIDFEFTPEYFERVEVLWKDPGVQAAYERSNEYQLIDCASYFMAVDKMREVARPEYKPSNQDILLCRVRTRGILETHFSVEKVKFHLFDVGGQRGERRKWVQCFNDVTAVIFIVASSSYNLMLAEDSRQNRLQEALDLFDQIWKNRWLREVSVILFLNKQDKLKEKITAGKFKLETYFPDYEGYQPPNNAKPDNDDTPETVRAKYFIRDMFLLISKNVHIEHKYLYPYFTTAIDTENIKRVFNTCRDIIQRLHLKEYDLL